MAIIDELILRLGIDSSGLDDGEQRMAESLRRMETQATRSAGEIGQSSAKSLRDYLAGFEVQFNQVNENLVKLGKQGKKSGSDVAEGAKSASYGISELTFAALAAYGALKAVQGVVGTVQAQVAQTSSLFRTAGMLNPPPGESTGDFARRLFAFTHAAHTTTGVDPGAALASIQQLQVGRQAVRAGLPLPENLAALSRFFNIDFNASLEDIIRSLETQAQNDPDALVKLQQAGFGSIAQYLRRGPAANARSEALEGPYAPTNKEFESAQKLTEQTGLLGDSFDRLWREMIVTNPAVLAFVNALKAIVDLLSDPASFLNKPLGELFGGPGWNSNVEPPGTTWLGRLGHFLWTGQWYSSAMGRPAPTHGFSGNTANISGGPGTGGDVLALIRNLESSNRNLPPNATNDSGWYQINQGTWNSLPQSIRGNYGAAWEAPYETQTNAATYIYNHPEISGMGPRAWVALHRPVTQAPGDFDPNQTTLKGFLSRQPINWGTGTGVGPWAHPTYTDADWKNLFGDRPHDIPFSGVEKSADLARVRADLAASVARGRSGPVSTHVTTGDIHIHGHGEDAGRAAADALHEQIQVNLSNSGIAGP